MMKNSKPCKRNWKGRKMKPKRIKQPKKQQFNVRLEKSLLMRMNMQRLKLEMTWPQYFLALFESYAMESANGHKKQG